ncbi:MAG: acetate/propionate family kinase [Clostridiales bacterium]|nr:acetate/propionate family kinase [Clostridiales bacterium]
MHILVINTGSSSIKYQLINMEDESVVAKGVCERNGADGRIIHSAKGKTVKFDVSLSDYKTIAKKIIPLFLEGETAVVGNLDEIGALAHRVSIGGELAGESIAATNENIRYIERFIDLAPIHMPVQLAFANACREVFEKQVHAIVFDSACHLTMPEKAYLYPIPYEYYEKYGIRKFGYHSISFRYIAARIAEIKGQTNLQGIKLVACHLGSGSSIAAIKDGKSVDTTMGYTPLDGIMMGTRSGTVDPSALIYLAKYENLSFEEVTEILNHKSGFLGVSGVSNDSREIEAEADKGNKRAKVTNEMFAYQAKKYIGSYAAAMNGIDILAFSGGIGENSVRMRERICKEMEFFGIELDEKKNHDQNQMEGRISKSGSRVEIWIIPTNEEITMARDAYDILRFGKPQRP